MEATINVQNKTFSQTVSDAFSSVRDAVTENPKAAAVAATALAGAAAYAINPSLFALEATDYGYFYNTTAPTLLGKAVNLVTLQPDESVNTLKLVGFQVGTTAKWAGTTVGSGVAYKAAALGATCIPKIGVMAATGPIGGVIGATATFAGVSKALGLW